VIEIGFDRLSLTELVLRCHPEASLSRAQSKERVIEIGFDKLSLTSVGCHLEASLS